MARRPKRFGLAPYLRGRDDAKGARRGQGILLAFDPITKENTVSYRGTPYTNMPLLTVTDSINYRAGDTVVIEGWGPEGRLSSWYIIGRVIVPPVVPPEE